MPYGSQFDPEAYGSHVPAEFAGQFRTFMLLVILSEVDGLILQHSSMPVSIKNSKTFCSTPHDPMSAELGLVLEDMEAITSHDGGSCCLPSRQDIAHYWHDFKSSLVRNVNGTADEPNDFYLPAGVGEGKGW